MSTRTLRVRWGVVVYLLVAMTPLFADVLPTNLKIDPVLDNSGTLTAMEISPTGEIWLLENKPWGGLVRVHVAGAETASCEFGITQSCDSGVLGLAFAPDYVASGLTFLYRVNDAGDARVDRLYHKGGNCYFGEPVLTLGTPIDGCRPGGGVSVGPDEKLYVGVGDMGAPLDAQDDAKIQGKVLRANLDGSVPGDNASGTLLWAKGFRHVADIDVGWNGTVYGVDQGDAAVFDETNAVLEGNNHGWNIVSGDSGGVYDDPLTADLPLLGPDGVNLLGPGLGEDHEDTLAYACRGADEIRQAVLTGPNLDQLEEWRVSYHPLADATGVPDVGCPKRFDTLAEGGDGWLYGANSGENPGVWRIWQDTPGPREVSAPGSPLQLTVNKVSTTIELEWEDLGPREAHLAKRPAALPPAQPEQTYRIWQGTLPFTGYDHTTYLSTDGTPATGVARLKHDFPAPTESRYYLISAQGDNMEGSLGTASNGTERPGGGEDYCDAVGYGSGSGQCAGDWYNPTNEEPQPLIDYNPYSETYLQAINLSDFRGKVIRIDVSALDCTFCQLQTTFVVPVEHDYAARDMVGITIMTESSGTLAAIPTALCESSITAWADNYGVTNPIVGDVDSDGNGNGDATDQWWREACGGTPQNFYIDQGFRNYEFVCGGELTYLTIENKIKNEVNPETCE
jgi:hypothetical protein